jgi:hypothetical protein
MKLRCAISAGALSLLASKGVAQPAAEARFRGQGAAQCIAAGELLAGQPGADARIRDGVLAWRQVLHVMDATEDRRGAALDLARASFARADSVGAGMGKTAAEAYWSSACAGRDVQVRYIAVHASEDRARNNLADEPGAELGAEAVRRLNAAASCLVSAELLSSPRPSGSLRTALREARPRVPGPDVLQAIQARSRRAIDDVPGSTAGKALMVDYLRYLFNGASGGSDPRPFVNLTSQHLRDRCQPGAGSGEPAP